MPTIVPGRTLKRFRPRPLLRTSLAYAVAVLLFGAVGATCDNSRFDNPGYVPDVPDPSYPDEDGPIVYFDEAHANHQSSTHGLVALAALAAADGFEVLDLYDPWDQADLTGASIVIQALPATTTSQSESNEIRQFVAQGGGFLGITDHPDHPLSMAALAAGFGVSFVNTVVLYNSSTSYSFGPSLLAIHPITDGVGYVQSYNGSAIAQWPSNATSILTFGEGAIDDATGASLEGASRLVCGQHGGGRFCFASELQMLSSKCQTTCGNLITGFDGHQQGIPNAEYNEVFALQLLRWLDGEIND